MSYLLVFDTPDSNGVTEEDHETIESMQKRKDELFAMPWVTGSPSVIAFNATGDEVYLK